MVKFFFKPPIIFGLRHVYDKSLWVKIKTLYGQLAEHNPTLAYLVLPVWPFLLTSAGIIGYLKRDVDVRPKYYEHYFVIRPDDPRVKNIRHDDCLRISGIHLEGELSMAR